MIEIEPIIAVLWVLSLIHVGLESFKKKRVGRPFWHIVMVGLVVWPLGYLLWLFYWPGSLRKSKAEQESEAWIESILRKNH